MQSLKRETKETAINAKLEIYGSGNLAINSGIGFFDHMLCALFKHSLMDCALECRGDLEVDFHHSVEDCGIVLGELLNKSIYPVANIERFGHGVAVMDESCIECSIDLSNRAYFVFEVPHLVGKIGEFDAELIEEFFKSLVNNAKINAHIIYKRGTNKHHIAEAVFKSFAIALKNALKENKRAGIPSTKGVL